MEGTMTMRISTLSWFCFLAAACSHPPVQSPTVVTDQSTSIRVPQSPENKVDILFMIDNSPSMAAMQDELKNRFGDFFTVFDQLAATGTYTDLHIGIITSDYGAGDTAEGGCAKSPGGDLGHLQQLGHAAAAGCQGPTDNYISYVFGPNDTATSNLQGASSPANLVGTFTCMASGGAAGCGFEHQLESAYAALKDTTSTFNKGFLREDALLTVVFLTNEDDGSAYPTTHMYESAASATFGAYDTYRQTEWAIECGGTHAPYASSNGPLTDCSPLDPPPGDAYPIDRYINFFTRPAAQGGVKANPNDVILVAIDAPPAPFSTLLATSTSGNGAAPSPTFVPCSAISPTCQVRLQHSCQNMSNPAFFGDPPLRLDAVVNAAKFHQIANICGDDPTQTPDYTNALQNLGGLIIVNIGNGCIPSKVPDVSNVECAVVEVTPQADGTNVQSAVPACASSGATPCWKVEAKSACTNLSPDGLGVTVDYGTMDAGLPQGTYINVQCVTEVAES
jgi:hypothetical protein